MPKEYTKTKRFKKLAKEYNEEMDKPFGPEWEKHMMTWRKKDLIELIKKICLENTKKKVRK